MYWQSYISLVRQAGREGPLSSIAVYTPAWLPVFALIFSTLTDILSSLHPALQVASMIPVQALKYV
ncbi:MAG: hypothetical protein K8S20_10595 [Chloroflexi bacterium]|nr:hypothetical protein [Chloroflexota bacterium]